MKKLLLLLLLSSTLPIFAQRIAGSEIYYERTGNRQYKVTAVVYRECDSDPLLGINGYVYAGTTSMNLPFSRVSIQKINDTCNQPCQITNDVSRAGFEKHTFVSNVDFNDNSYKQFLSFCEVGFAFRQGGRDNRTTTHGTGMYFNEATVNICDSTISNSSPRFSMDPKFKALRGWTLEYSPGPLDTIDFDSLSFQMFPVQTAPYSSVSYNPSFRYDLPLTCYCSGSNNNNCIPVPGAKPARGFYFDSKRCQLIFTPIDPNDLGYVRIRVSEFRKVNNKMVYLGSVYREMLLDVVTAMNMPTYFSTSYNSTNISNCSDGYNLSFVAKDDPYTPWQTTGDTTSIIYDNGYRNAAVTINKNSREASINLSLTNKMGLRKNQIFTVGIYDKKCNESLVTRTYLINQFPVIDYTTSYSIDSCNNLTAEAKLKDSTLIKSGYINIIAPDGSFKTYNGNFPLNQNGTYFIQYIYTSQGNICNTIKFDTIKINNAFLAPVLNQKSDTLVCRSTPVTLNFKPSAVKDLASWTWYINDSIVNTSDSSIANRIYSNSLYQLELKNTKGCYSSKFITFISKTQNQNIISSNKLSMCSYRDTMIGAYSLNFNPPVAYTWMYNGDTVKQSSNIYKFKSHEASKTKTLKVYAVDDNHCEYIDSLPISTYQYPSYVVNIDKPGMCRDTWVEFRIDSLTSKNIKQIRWSTPTFILSTNTLSVRRLIDLPTKLLSYVLDSNNCKHADTVDILPLINPTVKVSKGATYCQGNTMVLKANINKGYSANIRWYIDGQLVQTGDTSLSHVVSNNGKVNIVVDNSGACFAKDSTTFKRDFYPVVNIKGDTIYNILNKIDLYADRTLPNYYWSTGQTTPVLNSWASSFGPPGAYKIWLRSYSSNNCVSYDTITIHTDGFTSVADLSAPKLSIYPNPTDGQLNIISDKVMPYSLMNAEGKCLMQGMLEIGEQRIELSGLSSGIYTLVTEAGRMKFSKL